MELGDRFTEVFVRQIRCQDLVEKLYYSVGKHQPVCLHCCAEGSLTVTPNFYPSVLTVLLLGKNPPLSLCEYKTL